MNAGDPPPPEDHGSLDVENPLQRHGYIRVYRALLLQDVSLLAAVAYGQLISYYERYGDVYPGLETLAKEIGSSSSALSRALNELVEKELVEKRRRGQGKTNVYVVKDPKGSGFLNPEIGRQESRERAERKTKESKTDVALASTVSPGSRDGEAGGDVAPAPPPILEEESEQWVSLAQQELGFGPQARPWLRILQTKIEAAGLETNIYLEAVACKDHHTTQRPGAAFAWQKLLLTWVRNSVLNPPPILEAPTPALPPRRWDTEEQETDWEPEKTGIGPFDRLRHRLYEQWDNEAQRNTYRTFLSGLWARPVDQKGNLPIICETPYVRDWLATRLDDSIRRALQEGGDGALNPVYIYLEPPESPEDKP